jgi:hypothetical protein
MGFHEDRQPCQLGRTSVGRRPDVAPRRGNCSVLWAGLLLMPALCAAWPDWRTGAAEWPDEYQAGQFTCHADFPLASYRSLLLSMPDLQRDIGQALRLQPSRESIHLFLFQKKSTYQTYVKQYFPDAPARNALFIKGRGPGMVFAHLGEGFEDDIRHECTHALLNACLPMVPLWLDEGLAEYFEVPADQRAYGGPHLSAVKWSTRFGQVPRLEVLEHVRDVNEMGRTRYRQAWAWVHFMLHGPPEVLDELRRFLADIQALTPPGQLHERLSQRLPDLEQQFAAHFKNWKR